MRQNFSSEEVKGSDAAAVAVCSVSLSLRISLTPANSIGVLVASLKVSLKMLSRQCRSFVSFELQRSGGVAFEVATWVMDLSLVVRLAL